MNYEPSDLKVADPEETTMPRSPDEPNRPRRRPSRRMTAEAPAARRGHARDPARATGGPERLLRLQPRRPGRQPRASSPGKVTAIIGPSGCGKSTMVRCVNRMHEEIPGARSEGRVLLDDVDLHASNVDVVAVRRLVGMVFQKPNPFPTMSIFDNVAAGLRFTGTPRDEIKDRVEPALEGAGLWDEVKDRLSSPGWASPAASSSACASRGRWRSSRTCC